MGSNHSSETIHCNRYLNGQGPPSLEEQANGQLSGKYIGLTGSQPLGQMTWKILHKDLPGFIDDDTIQITYVFPNGTQMEKHPHPGHPYVGTQLCAYLPDSREGNKVLKLLEKAFNQQVLFTIATNKYGEDVITTASIPLKTQPEGGIAVNGYPDADYLKTVRKLFKDKGID
ncbi:E3 ubiquitin-protein ligase DTX3L1 [Pholidichthys leucotaenia]